MMKRMARKQPPRRPQKKVPPRPQAKAKAKTKAKAKPKTRQAAAQPRVTEPTARPRLTQPAAPAAELQLQEAMEELAVAREELSRLGHELSASRRAVDDCRLSSGSAEEHLRSQMMALREELRTALAELE